MYLRFHNSDDEKIRETARGIADHLLTEEDGEHGGEDGAGEEGAARDAGGDHVAERHDDDDDDDDEVEEEEDAEVEKEVQDRAAAINPPSAFPWRTIAFQLPLFPLGVTGNGTLRRLIRRTSVGRIDPRGNLSLFYCCCCSQSVGHFFLARSSGAACVYDCVRGMTRLCVWGRVCPSLLFVSKSFGLFFLTDAQTQHTRAAGAG